MNDIKYKELIKKLDSKIEMLTSFSPKVPCPVEYPHSAGFIINEDMNINEISDKTIPLVHSMLHMFYQNKNGKGLKVKTIESLHSKVVKRLKEHKNFDKLDKNG